MGDLDQIQTAEFREAFEEFDKVGFWEKNCDKPKLLGVTFSRNCFMSDQVE